ncbi:MAG: tripartite tricarboxylate transporter permease [Phyllobacterium sp.]
MLGFEHLFGGLAIAIQPQNLIYALVGCLIGSLVGVLPGLGPLLTMALLLPLTYGVDPLAGLILLSSIYYGAMYGGSTTSILLNLPGENASVVTSFDGYQLRLQGRAGAALSMAAIASFIAGMFAVMVLVLLAFPMAQLALKLGAPETFLILVSALLLVGVISDGNAKKGALMTLLGLLAGTLGTDIISGRPRLTMGMPELLSGLEVSPVVIGLFALGEVLSAAPIGTIASKAFKYKDLVPTRKDFAQSAAPIARASVVGTLLGILPGAGPTIASYIAYGIERRIARDPSRFGRGAIEGVAAPEAANNAASTGSLIPLLTLGIPGSAAAAVLLSAFILYGLQPGPELFNSNPDIAWGLIASMVIGNIVLLILNLPLVGLFIQVLRMPYPALGFLTILLSILGTYSINVSLFEVWLVLIFGAIGLLCRRTGYPIAPFVLSFILGKSIEGTLRQSLLLTDDGLLIFLQRPISLAILVLLAILMVAKLAKTFRPSATSA